MTRHDIGLDRRKPMKRLVAAVDTLGYEIVDISGFFDLVEGHAGDQTAALDKLKSSAAMLRSTTADVGKAVVALSTAAAESRDAVDETVSRVRASGKDAQHMATWIADLSARTVEVSDTLKAAKSNNQQIVAIARQVNTLAINAKIEAARAGDAGRGFSVVADAINELSQKTSTAAVEISENIEMLTGWIVTLTEDAKQLAARASSLLEHAELNDQSLSKMERAASASHDQSTRIRQQVGTVTQALETFAPSLKGIEDTVRATTKGISMAHDRLNKLIDTSETVVQDVAAIGGASADTVFFTFVQSAAKQISDLFTQAVERGEIRPAQMFDTTYRPLPGTNPQQVVTAFTDLADRLLPAIQEPALALDPRVVFCAAVDRNGYLPTHNKKFSAPQRDDPVWNTAHCRNRRIFDDRVGLKAGRSTAPFLCQVYRRDMGGGEFAMMKDISAPIYVADKHWGGLRLAVKF